MRSTAEAIALVRAFSPSPEEEKSRELILALLELHRGAVFARSVSIPATLPAPPWCCIRTAAAFC